MEAIISPALHNLEQAAPSRARAADSTRLSPDWIVGIAIIGDFVSILIAATLALVTRQYLDFGFETKGFKSSDYYHTIFLGTLIYLFLLQFNGAYRKHYFIQRRSRVLAVTFKTAVMWAALFLTLTLVFEMQSTISRLFVFLSLLNSLVLLVGWRLALRWFLYTGNWAPLLRDRVLVVGWSKESDSLATQIVRDPGHPYEVIGCTPSAHGKFLVRPSSDIAILGNYNAVQEVLRENQPDILILADLDPAMGELIALAQLCVKENVQFKVIPSYFQIFVSGLHLESIGGVPVIGISKLPLDHLHNRFLKQVVDIIGGIVGLLLSAPLILIFGILIYHESPGPIFYTQSRSGRGGRVFKIYKLRSMKLNADAKGAQWAVENDPRRLRIGEFMRKNNIDEVPQFWNVLKGDMSLVGPRPEMTELIANWKEEITYYNARHCAKPGITGYAQVNGMRGNCDLKERVRYDLFYLENWSLWLDIQILLKTFFVRTNAY